MPGKERPAGSAPSGEGMYRDTLGAEEAFPQKGKEVQPSPYPTGPQDKTLQEPIQKSS